MTEPVTLKKQRLGWLWRIVSPIGLTLLWGAFLTDLGQWAFRLSGGYSPIVNLLSHFWSYLSLGGALGGLLARGAPNVLRSVPTVWLLVSLAILYGGQVISPSTLPPPAGMTLRVLTLNLGQRNDTRPQAIAFLKERRNLDVLFLQEVYANKEKGDPPKFEAALKDQLPNTVWLSFSGSPGRKYGLGIMSRYPLSQSRSALLPENDDIPPHCRGRSVLTTNVRVQNRSLRLVTAHLCRLAIPWRRNGKMVLLSRRTIFYWLDNIRPSEYARRIQIDFLRKMVMEGGPIILAGDLNTTSHSLDLLPLSRMLTNAFEERGWGFGFTFYVGFMGVGERIDHIFHSPEIRTREAFVHDVKVSDHRPLETVLEIMPEKMVAGKNGG